MAKLIMERKMGDNLYLHKDFHASMDIALAYIDKRYGKEGIEEYLARFTDSYHKELIGKIQEEGLSAFKDYLVSIFAIEECADCLKVTMNEESLYAVISKGFYVYSISKCGQMVLNNVYGRILNKSGYNFELLFLDDTTGACEFKVKRIGR